QTILLTPDEYVLQQRDFFLVGSDNHFSTKLVGDIVLVAERSEFVVAVDAVLCLQASQLIIYARMDNIAVVTRLMPGDSILFFQHKNTIPGFSSLDFQGGSQSNSPSSYNDYVVLHSSDLGPKVTIIPALIHDANAFCDDITWLNYF